MIDERLLLKVIRKTKEEFEEKAIINFKEYTSASRNMEPIECIKATTNIHTLINLTRVLNKLIELIENGEFDVIENPKKRSNKNDR